MIRNNQSGLWEILELYSNKNITKLPVVYLGFSCTHYEVKVKINIK